MRRLDHPSAAAAPGTPGCRRFSRLRPVAAFIKWRRQPAPTKGVKPPHSKELTLLKAPVRSTKILASSCELSKLLAEMSKEIVGDHLWAEMTEDEKIDAVITGHATLKQMSEGVLDGSEKLRRACRDSLAHLAPSLDNLAVDIAPGAADRSVIAKRPSRQSRPTHKKKPKKASRQRFGLPDNFIPRLQRFGRAVLLEMNIYQLPNGQEFIPTHPLGTLGQRQHLYALLRPNNT